MYMNERQVIDQFIFVNSYRGAWNMCEVVLNDSVDGVNKSWLIIEDNRNFLW